MSEATVSSVASWKNRKDTILELPSGHSVRVFNPGLKTFLMSGSIPNSLLATAESALAKGQPIPEPKREEMMNNPKAVADMLKMVDVVAMGCIVEPPVYPIPDRPEEREGDKLYIDEIDDEDKLFIFSWATGGPTDLEQFRTDLTGTLAALQPGTNLEDAAVGATSD